VGSGGTPAADEVRVLSPADFGLRRFEGRAARGSTRMSPVDQVDVVEFLTLALSRTGTVNTATTHISRLFLGGSRVFKLKRAVRFPYLDFSTPERRLAACEAEVALNRRTAPALYLGARRITRDVRGDLAFDGPGDLVDAVVVMRRFPEADLFDAMARDGRLKPSHIADLAQVIATFHAGAEIHRNGGGAAAIGTLIDMNGAALQAAGLVSAEAAEALTTRFRVALARHAVLLDSRRAAGKVRRCHGDLTLRNICLFEGRPTPFDCIEFSETIATTDILYDLAFVLMDLWHRERCDLANLLLNRYLDATEETDGIGLLPFLMALRAVIRAHVTAAQATDATGDVAAAKTTEARAYLALGDSLLADKPVVLLAIGGFSGSGKSSVAAAVAPWIGSAPGARILSSDRIRKRLHGVDALTRLPASAYAPAVSHRVYAALRIEAARVLAAGHCAVADAVFDRPSERKEIEAVARDEGADFRGVWLEAPAAMLARRIEGRVDDPSDATPAVLAAQVARGGGAIAWHCLPADRSLDVLRANVLSLTGQAFGGSDHDDLEGPCAATV
jgi:aminoglycoside phosphotransferase family enzyme/predicted kinase